MGSRHRWVSCLVLFLTLFGLLFPGGALAGSNVQPAGSRQNSLPTPPFEDVIGTEYQGDVGVLWQLGVAGGTSPTTFSPWDRVTRGQAAAFIIRALKRTGESASGPVRFRDVPANHYALNSISLADQLGIIKGTSDTTFDPDGNVTHAQLATMLMRALGYESLVTGEWPANYVLKAKDEGLLTGIPFELNKEATRAETARFLVNAIFTVKNPFTKLTLSQSVFRVPATLVIGPDATFVAPGEVALKAVGQDWYGNTFDVDRVQWKVVSGSAQLNGSKVTLQAGTVTVEARTETVSATKTYQVAKSLEVTPASSAIRPGQTVTLSATVAIEGQGSQPVVPQWTVQSGPATVSAAGVVTMTSSGAATITATYGSFTKTATVVAGAGLSITPADPVIAVGETVSFSAKVTDAPASTVPVVWSVISGDGKISSNGLFTAGRQTSVVQASSPGLTSSVTVKVINRLEITPTSASLNKAETVSFVAKAYTSDNQPVADVKPTWDLSDKTLGILDTEGVLVATGSGRGQVTARFRGLTATAPVAVAGDPASVIVTSSNTSLPANGTSQATITARIVDRNGITVKGERTITFSTSNSLATLNTTAVTTTTGEATATLTVGRASGTMSVLAATPGVISGQAQLSLVSPSPSKIVLSASPSVINADAVSTSTITATLVDVAGQPTTNLTGASIPVYLTQTGTVGTLLTTQLAIPVGGTSTTTLFRSNAYTGSATISANSSIPVEAVTVRTAIVGPAAKLEIRPITATIANGVAQMLIEVEVQDSNGVMRAMDGSQMVYLSAAGPSTLSLYPAQVIRGVASFRVTTTTAGSYTFTASSGALQAATATGNFVAGPANKLLLTAEPVTDFAADAVSTTTMVAKVVDANGNPVTTTSPAITFHRSSSGNAIAWTNDVVVPATDGVAKLSVKSTAFPGTETFTASANGLTTSGVLTLKTTITGVASKVRVQPITGTTVGGETTVTVHVLDNSGHLVTRDNGRMISLAAVSATAVYNSPQPTVNGIATFTLSNNVAESIKVTASSSGLDSDETGATVTFRAGDAVRIVLVAEPTGLAASTTGRSWISAYAVDSLGNRLSRVINITLSLSTSNLGNLSNVNIVSGAASPMAFFTPNGTVGQVVVSGNSSLPVTPITLSTYQPGVPTRVVVETTPTNPVVGTPVTVKVRILDSNGNLASWMNSGSDLSHVGLSLDGASTQSGTTTTTITSSTYATLLAKGFPADGVTRGAAPIINGEATLTLTNTRAQTVTLTPFVWYNNSPMAVTAAPITTLAGPATQLTAYPTTLLLPANSSTQSNLVLTLADRYGNPVTGATDTVTVTANSSSYLSLPSGTTYPLGSDGAVVVPVKSVVNGNGGTTRLTFVATKANVSTQVNVTTDVPPDAPTVSFTSSTLANGSGYARIYVDARTLRNAPQKILVFVNGMQVNLYQTSSGSTELVTEIPGGSYTAAGYVRIPDLGGPGVKTVQAYLVTDLGISPASPVFTLTVTP